jgi:integrase
MRKRLKARLNTSPRDGWNAVLLIPLGDLRDGVQHDAPTALGVRRGGVPWITTHTLRRTAATMMDKAGMAPVEVANVLGHTRVSMAQDV